MKIFVKTLAKLLCIHVLVKGQTSENIPTLEPKPHFSFLTIPYVYVIFDNFLISRITIVTLRYQFERMACERMTNG